MGLKSLVVKLKNKHFLSLAGNGVMSVLGMVSFMLLIKFLPSAAEMGKWVFFLTTLTLLDTCRSGFLTTAIIKFYAGSTKERANEVIGSAWWLGLVITGAFCVLNLVALLLFHNSGSSEVVLFLKWFGITFIVTLPVFIANCVLQAESRFDRLLVMRMLNQVSFVLFIVVLIFMNKLTLESVFYSNLISSLITALYLLVMGWTRPRTIVYKTMACVREMYHYGKYVVGTAISAYLLRASDTYMILLLFPDKEYAAAMVAVYNLGLKLLEVVEIPLRSFNATAMPTMAAFFNQNRTDEMMYTMKKYTGMLSLALIPVAIMALLTADIFVPLVNRHNAGPEAANVWRIFMTFAILFPLDRFFAATLDVVHQPKINTIKVILMLIVNVVGDAIAIKLTGSIYGVAVATLFPTLVGMLVGYYYLNKSYPFSLRSVFTVGYHEIQLIVKQQLSRLRLIRG